VNGGGEANRFQINIWDRSAGDAVVYGNQIGDADDAEFTTILGGGSIVIHSGEQGGPKAGMEVAGAEAIGDERVSVRDEFALRANYLNPFARSTTVAYDLPESAPGGLRRGDRMGLAALRAFTR
jgi:hypothetical protein